MRRPPTPACSRSYPKGYSLDATHHPHITLQQRYVRTADLDKTYAAAGKILAIENVTNMKLKAVKYYYFPDKAEVAARRSRAQCSRRDAMAVSLVRADPDARLPYGMPWRLRHSEGWLGRAPAGLLPASRNTPVTAASCARRLFPG